MRTCVVVAVAALTLGSAPPPRTRPDDQARADLAKMQGVWVRRGGVDGYGQPLPPPLDPVVIEGGRLIQEGGASYALRLDAGREPRRLDMEEVTKGGGGKAYRGVYKLDGDRLTLCGETAGPGRPESFEPRTPGAVLEVYSRLPPDVVRRLREVEAPQKASYRWLGPQRWWLTVPAGR
jgi:uncharacterized protein (TIGR03067 family)